jgi:rhomboid family GlyGly-CTERM serine protease
VISKFLTKSSSWRFALPLGIGIAAALAELGGEPLRLALRYEREALGSGEIWRLMTGHLVHLGPSHAAMNILALAVLAFLFARLLTGLDWCVVSLGSVLAIDAGLYWLSPAVEWYVGLSGVLHGVWAAACVLAFRARRAEAWALAALLLIKLIYETVAGPVPLTGQVAAGPVVAVAHLYGAVGGTLAAVLTPAIRSLVRPL